MSASKRPLLPALAGLGLAALVAGAGAATSVFAEESGAERTRQLSHLVRQDCGACHGLTLKGGLGRPLLPEALADLETEAIAHVILDGVPGTPMPPWRGELSEADALWIARALKRGDIE